MPSLCTLAQCKAFKNITVADHDTELARIILAVDDFVDAYCGRTLSQATFTEFHSTSSGDKAVVLKNPPVASITSIHDDPARVYDSAVLVPATDYVFELGDHDGRVWFDGPRTGGNHNLKVIYVGGYATIKDDLTQAAIELAWLARDKGDLALLGLRSKGIAQGSFSMLNNEWPAGVKNILDLYDLSRAA